MPAIYDLHTHSTASDGTLTPAELVRRAAAAGIEILALTDHDTLDGVPQAEAAAAAAGIELVPGVEISVSWQGCTIHVLGLGVDPAAPVLREGLAGLLAFRDWRAEEIGRRLGRAGIDGAFEAARARAKGRIVSRTHFAQFLVEAGHARDLRQVFKRYLVQGRPGHVPGRWAELETAVDWIRQAGGVAVIAHPARYRLTATRLRRLVGEFRECGGEGLEVVSGSHSPDEVRHMAAVARRERLLASCGSDYHGPEHPWVELGRLASLPEDCTPVWTAWAAA